MPVGAWEIHCEREVGETLGNESKRIESLRNAQKIFEVEFVA
jgi:hypothetical protein